MAQLLGVDVSHYQHPGLPWATWRAAGVRFAIIRAGLGYVIDHGAEMHRRQARAAGLYTGSYWLVMDHDREVAQFDPVRSARAFDRLLPPGDEIHPFVDVELPGVDAALLMAFLLEFERLRPGTKIGIYTSRFFWQEYGGSGLIGKGHYEFARFPLWVAMYGVNGLQDPPRLPDAWEQAGYVCYQFRYKKGYLPGYANDLDINLWSGELPMPATNDQLKGLLAEANSMQEDANVLIAAGQAAKAKAAKMSQELAAMIAAPPPPPPPPPPAPIPLFKVKVIVLALNVRSGTAATYPDVGDVLKDEVLDVYEVAVPSGWLRIHPTEKRWISGSSAYTVKV